MQPNTTPCFPRRRLIAHLKASNATVEVTTLHDPRFTTTLELAVRFGKTLVVQEADRVHVNLYPLLRRDLLRQGPRFVVQVRSEGDGFTALFLLLRRSFTQEKGIHYKLRLSCFAPVLFSALWLHR